MNGEQWTYQADAAPVAPREDRGIAGEELWIVGNPTPAGQVVTERTALRMPAMLAAVAVLATDVAVLPLNVFKRRKDGGRDHAFDDPREEFLNLNPDGQEEGTAVSWRASWMLHALSYGNGYAEIRRAGGGTSGRVVGIDLADPEAIKPKRVDKKLVYVDSKSKQQIPAKNILHLAGLAFDGLVGLNFIQLVKEAIGVGLAGQGFTADYFANGADPGGVIEMPQTISKEAGDRLIERFEGRHQGAGKRHRVALLEQGAKYNPGSVNAEQMQLIEARKFQALEVLRPWRVPPHKAGDFSQSHLANIEASNLDYLMTALMFWLVSIEQQATLKLFTRAERMAGYFVEHNTNALLRGDIKTRFDAYAIALDKGWMSRDEVRRRENLNPIGEDMGGSKYLVQLNQTTLEKIGEDEPAEPPAVAAAEETDGEEINPAEPGDDTEDEGDPEAINEAAD